MSADYRVDDGAKFRAFADEERRTKGFARDLFIDLMRWSYFKGSIAWMNPRKLGLQQFPEEANVFEEFVKTYANRQRIVYSRRWFNRHCIPSLNVCGNRQRPRG